MNARDKIKNHSRSQPSRARRGVSVFAFVLLSLLLVLPVYALIRLATWIDWRLLVAGPLAVSVFTFFMYRSDKQSAEAGEWRLPEAMLHFVELMGGWPGAFLAQRMVRHKISKTSYQVGFWVIVLIHQFAALDFALGWRLTHGALRFLKLQTG
jgi:uncharacterized membrane protein YsdA (DUF1294 family)